MGKLGEPFPSSLYVMGSRVRTRLTPAQQRVRIAIAVARSEEGANRENKWTNR